MDAATAIKVFGELEAPRWSDADGNEVDLRDLEPDEEPWDPPCFHVRLDARQMERDDSRSFRIWARLGSGSVAEADAYRYILDLAEEHELGVTIDNAGIELR